MWLFSPFVSGALAMNVVILLIGYRILNLAETHVSLALLTQNGVASDLGQGSWSRFARRAFLVGATLPLYIILLVSTNDRLIQGIATTLVAHTVLAELSTVYCVTSYEVRGAWPRSILVARSVSAADSLTQDQVVNKGKARGSEKSKEHRHIAPNHVMADNLCDRVHQLSPFAAQPDHTFASQSFQLQQTPKLEKLFHPNASARWMCGHWRCLIYVILHKVVRAIGWSWSLIELGSTTWLLQCEVEPVTLRLAGKLLEVNILNGVISTLYDICVALFIFILVYIASMILVIRLFFFTPLITRLSSQVYILQRMQQKFQDLAEAAPITHRTLKALLIHCIPVISSYYGSIALITRAIGLTKEKLSFIFKIILISAIYITIYCLPVGSDQASTEPDVAPCKESQGTQDLDTTVSGSAHSDTHDEFPRIESRYPQTPKEIRSAIFRLAIVVPTLTVWVYFYR
ncbi:hypothetical protein ASPNIDRAFT_46107 [Aspergillus niger ATCC 1015]|uniref:Uncharacterized protein n=1 Tax=Aspergillus niger (strain ATCC 1015 / CBS 113.46 / FGSC A1144 / LSHB Ac4 / NCTC 3858a / NRRL 328 / USDA 3528.7) TaxID=380704 RepID=G3Y3X2_ASPNA|nr:hypothetical protein ASPNIDRAFT_46107 [Aspergillus niger ATCC 1015]